MTAEIKEVIVTYPSFETAEIKVIGENLTADAMRAIAVERIPYEIDEMFEPCISTLRKRGVISVYSQAIGAAKLRGDLS